MRAAHRKRSVLALLESCIDAGHELIASYQYEDGRYDAVAREFRGFRRVVRATSEGSTAAPTLAVTVFGQDALIKGRILQVDTYAGGDVVVRREINNWGTRSAGSNRSQIWLAEAQRATFDLGGVPLFRTTVSDPPDEYGNVTHSYSAGILDADRVETFTTYATPQSDSQVRRQTVAGAGHRPPASSSRNGTTTTAAARRPRGEQGRRRQPCASAPASRPRWRTGRRRA